MADGAPARRALVTFSPEHAAAGDEPTGAPDMVTPLGEAA
jgi:hypothetical protein